MAWTTPRTWVAGELVTAALFNTHIRDNENALPTVTSTITTTGTQTALALPSGRGNLTIFCNNASLLTLQGITAGSDGQRLCLYSIGAGQVDLADQNGSASAALRIITGNGLTISAAAGVGRITLEYDGTTARWRVTHHEQGEWISYTPSWTSSGSAPSIGNGTLAGRYYVQGRQVAVDIQATFGSTTTFGSGNYFFALPFTANDTTAQVLEAQLIDATGDHYSGSAYPATTTTLGLYAAQATNPVGAANPFTFANSDAIRISGVMVLA